MALIALCTATTTVSCGNDDNDNVIDTKYVTYSYEIGLSPDVLQLFDVSLKMTIGDKERILALTKEKTVTDAVTNEPYNFVTTGEMAFSGSTSETIKMEYIVTPKSDWAATIITKTEWKLYSYNNYEINNALGIKYNNKPVCGGTIKSGSITQTIMDQRAKDIKQEILLGK